MSLKSRFGGVLALVALAIVPATAQAAPPYGPDPTPESVRAFGPFTTKTQAIPDSQTPGFGAATLYTPTDTSQTYGAIAVAPGWTEYRNIFNWLGPRLASQGFVVLTFDVTNTWTDLPPARGAQLLKALDYLTGSSPAKAITDPSRTAVIGHSMGGGGTLHAAVSRPALKAAIGFEPWNQTGNFSRVRVPSLIVAAQNDVVAPVGLHAQPFYNSIPNSVSKAYLELRGADHFVSNKANTAISASTTAWLKRFVDGDTRYTQYLTTPSAAPSGSVLTYRTAGTL